MPNNVSVLNTTDLTRVTMVTTVNLMLCKFYHKVLFSKQRMSGR